MTDRKKGDVFYIHTSTNLFPTLGLYSIPPIWQGAHSVRIGMKRGVPTSIGVEGVFENSSMGFFSIDISVVFHLSLYSNENAMQ